MISRIDIHIWRLTPDDARLDSATALLSQDERDRAAAFLRPVDRDRFVLARAGLRDRLAGYVDQPADALAFGTVARKKPTLAGGPAFNLSHSAGLAALAVAPAHDEADLPLGIDIEAHRPVEQAVADLSFSPTEREALQGLSPRDWAATFFCGWTRKEAVIKALGTGLFTRLHSFDVAIAAHTSPRLLRASPEMPPPEKWAMRHFQLSADMPGALAVIGAHKQLEIHVRETPQDLSAVFRF